MSDAMPLKEALQECSKKVWIEMEPVSSKFSINQLREDALTSGLLKVLARSGCNQVMDIIESPKQGDSSEKWLGYDYDLWIGKGNNYVRYIIQAKSQRSGYQLNSTYEIETHQLVRMERFAITQKRTAVPLYAYYKHLQVSDLEIEKYFNSDDVFTNYLMGITLSTTTKIKPYSEISFKDLHSFTSKTHSWLPLYYENPQDIRYISEMLNATVPWHELASCSISQVQRINEEFKKIKKAGVIPIFILFPPIYGSNDDLIPIHKISRHQIVDYCFKRNFKDGKEIVPDSAHFQGRSLIILESVE